MKKSTTTSALLALVLGAGQTVAAESAPRWYTDEQVTQGKLLYTQQCAVCHGAEGVGTAQWQKRLPDGSYPPPPINGTAHAWHHPLDVLRRTVRQGGAKLGGRMPGFGDKLDEQEIDAVLAYVQSTWPDNVYAAWVERQSASGGLQAGVATQRDTAAPTRLLRQRLGTDRIGTPTSTPLEGIVQVKVGTDYVYVTHDGQYVFAGDMIELATGRNLTSLARQADILEQLAIFGSADRVVYPAHGAAKTTLVVFTDPTCPYCRKLHAELPQLQAAGVRVEYLPFPRGGSAGEGYSPLKQVWCAPDRAAAMDKAMSGRPSTEASSNCAAASRVDQGHRLGERIGVRGTPSLVLPDGQRVDGYVPAPQLLKALGLKGNELTESNQQ